MGRSHLEQYFLVLRPVGELYRKALEEQKLFCETYQLYQRMPMLHVTALQVEVIGLEVYRLIEDRVRAIAHQTKTLPLKSKGYRCYSLHHLSITLLLEKTKPLIKLSQDLEGALLEISGIKVMGPSLKEREYHITLASTLFSHHPWSKEEFMDLCHHIHKRSPILSGYAPFLEIWRPKLLPKEAIMASFPLLGK